MAKVLFSHSYYYPLDSKQWKFAQPYPPIGTIYAAAYLREHHFEVELHDTNLETSAASILPKLDKIKPKYVILYDDGFNYLTKMCLSKMRDEAFKMIQMAKEHNAVVILNSSDSTDHFEKYLDQGADYVIHGEGEISLLELLQALESGSDTSHIQGISRKVDGVHVKNLPRQVLKHLDQLPQPAWDLIDIEPYRDIWLKNHGYFSLNIATTRGCPYKCNWCAKPIYGNRYNTRSPKKVIDELAFLIEKFDVHYFWMCDDIFGLKPGWVQEFRSEKQKRNLEFQYKIQSRADLMLQDDNLDALVESGADMIWIGAESGSQKILDAMDKGTKVEQIYAATQNLQSRGAKIAFFLQFGYLDEDWVDIQKTINMVLDLMPDDIGISVSYPLPGTKFYDKVKSDLSSKSNWTDSNDLDMMFHNTFKPAFYKVLHRYVHNRYKIKKGWLSLKSLLSNPIKDVQKNIKGLINLCYHLPLSYYHAMLLKKYRSN